MALPILWRQQKAVELHPPAEVEDDPRITLTVVTGTNGTDHRVVQRQLTEITTEVGATQIDDQPLGCAQGKSLVLHRSAEIEHQSQLVIRTPEPRVANLRGRNTKGQCEGRAGQNQVEQVTSVHGESPLAKKASSICM